MRNTQHCSNSILIVIIYVYLSDYKPIQWHINLSPHRHSKLVDLEILQAPNTNK